MALAKEIGRCEQLQLSRFWCMYILCSATRSRGCNHTYVYRIIGSGVRRLELLSAL